MRTSAGVSYEGPRSARVDALAERDAGLARDARAAPRGARGS